MHAIVINHQPLGESDLIVSLLTHEHGLVKGVARGARRSVRRFAGCFEPFTYLDVGYVTRAAGGLGRVDSADIIDAHYGMRESLERIEAGSLMLELAALLESPGHGSAESFSLLRETIMLTEKSRTPMGLCAVFFIKLLMLAGYKVPHESCARCRAPLHGKPAIYPGGTGLYCPACAAGYSGVSLSAGSLAFIRRAESIEYPLMDRLRLGSGAAAEVMAFLVGFVKAVTGRNLKSASVAGPKP